MTDDTSTQAKSEPASSAMALSLAEVHENLPQGVTLERELGASILRMKFRNIAPSIAIAVGAFWLALYGVDLIGATTSFAAAGVVASYMLFGAIVGRRSVVLDREGVTVTTKPLPMIGDHTVPRDRISALEIATVGKRSGFISYRIDAVQGDKRTTLVDEIERIEQARVVGRYLAEQLNLPEPRRAESP